MKPTCLLQLLQLSDSAVPIGSAAHSFGLETLAAEEAVTVDDLVQFLEDYLTEAGARDAAYCRAAHRLAGAPQESFGPGWLTLNQQLSALQPARESRAADATLGRRFLQLAATLTRIELLARALGAAKATETNVHHATAFGLAVGALGLSEEEAALAFLQQSITALVSAGQRLMPLGQARASALLWRLHPSMAQAAATTDTEVVTIFTPMLDLAAMRHPTLATRLFIS
jgi:urease accessory protein